MRATLPLLLLLTAPAAAQQLIEWSNTQGGQWHVPTNWSPQDIPGDGILDEEAAKFVLFGTRTIELPSFRFELTGLEVSNGNYTFSTVGPSFGEIDVEGDTTVSQGVAQLKRASPGARDTALYTGRLFVSAGATLSLHDGAGLFGGPVNVGNHATKPTELAFYDTTQADVGDVTLADVTSLGRESLFSVYNNAMVEAEAVTISPTGIAGQEGVLQVIGGSFTANREIAVGPNTAGATALLAVSGGGGIGAKRTVTVGPTGTIRNLGGGISFEGDLVINGGQYVENSDEATTQWFGGSKLKVNGGTVSLMQPAATLPTVELTGATLFSTGALTVSQTATVEGSHLSSDLGITLERDLLVFGPAPSRVDGPVVLGTLGRIDAVSGDVTFGSSVQPSGSLFVREGAAATFEGDVTGGLGSQSLGDVTFEAHFGNGPGTGGFSSTLGTTTFAETATLEIDIAGAPSFRYDAVRGAAFALGGTLDVNLLPFLGPGPRAGQSFRIIDAVGQPGTSITGKFDTLDLDPLPQDLDWRLDYQTDAVFLRIISTLPGDYNGDGAVDAADYTVWRDSLDQVGEGLAADGNGDQRVDGDDYTYWRERFGDVVGGGSPLAAAVPEPSVLQLTIGLLLAAGIPPFRRYLIV